MMEDVINQHLWDRVKAEGSLVHRTGYGCKYHALVSAPHAAVFGSLPDPWVWETRPGNLADNTMQMLASAPTFPRLRT
jgi:hypothetical protein